MQLISCPWCGPREEVEFHYGGQAGVAVPGDADALTDEEWGRYLYVRPNPRGRSHERWSHSAGCRRWFTAVRDTVTYRFEGTSGPTTPGPTSASGAGAAGALP